MGREERIFFHGHELNPTPPILSSRTFVLGAFILRGCTRKTRFAGSCHLEPLPHNGSRKRGVTITMTTCECWATSKLQSLRSGVDGPNLLGINSTRGLLIESKSLDKLQKVYNPLLRSSRRDASLRGPVLDLRQTELEYEVVKRALALDVRVDLRVILDITGKSKSIHGTARVKSILLNRCHGTRA